MFHMSNTSLFNLEKFSSTDDWVDRKENGMHGMVGQEPEQVFFIIIIFYLLNFSVPLPCQINVRIRVRKQHETIHFQDMQDHQ